MTAADFGAASVATITYVRANGQIAAQLIVPCDYKQACSGELIPRVQLDILDAQIRPSS